QAVAAIIALAADDGDLFRRREQRERVLRYRPPGVLHQLDRWHPKLFGGDTVDLPHLRRGHDLHYARAAATDSSCDIFAASPITIRLSPARIGSFAVGLKRGCPSERRIANTMIPRSRWM